MRRIIALLLIIVLVSAEFCVVSAEQEEKYGQLKVQYSDNTGTAESLSVMVLDGHVYANAYELISRLGYQLSDSDSDMVTIYSSFSDSVPYRFVQLFYNDTQVNHMVFNRLIQSYEAPFKSIVNQNGIWIPFEYTLCLLNSGKFILDDTVLIEMPQKNIVDLFWDLMEKSTVYLFDWGRDFGYTESEVYGMGMADHFVNQLNGLLEKEGDSWKQLFQSIAVDSSAYDQKYGEDIAMLFCTQSDAELKKLQENVGTVLDMFSPSGSIGQFLQNYSNTLNADVEAFEQTCDSILEDVRNGNSSAALYSRAYRAFEKAFDKQTWFSETGETVLDVQKALKDTGAISVLDAGTKIVEVLQYAEEFQNQDEFAIEALENFLQPPSGNRIMSEAMSQSMNDYARDLKTNVLEYSAKRFFEENLAGWISDAIDSGSRLGSQANMVLAAWNLASGYIPFIANGLSAADKFEMALYSSILQADSVMLYQEQRQKVFEKEETVTPENLYVLSKYCYTYLKMCYITRSAALASLAGKTESVKDQIQPLIEYQNGINDEIAEYLVLLKNANTDNTDYVYGFLPSDNKTYLKEYSDEDLLKLVKQTELNESGEETLFASLPENFSFTSGVGAWWTELAINEDGTFEGRYQDSDSGVEPMERFCDFNGKFAAPRKVDEYIYTMSVEYLDTEQEAGIEYYEDGVLYVTSEPYGLENAKEVMLYIPGCPLECMSDDIVSWITLRYSLGDIDELPPGYFVLCDAEEPTPFIGIKEDETYALYEPLVRQYVGEYGYRRFGCWDIDKDGEKELLIDQYTDIDYAAVYDVRDQMLVKMGIGKYSDWGVTADGKMLMNGCPDGVSIYDISSGTMQLIDDFIWSSEDQCYKNTEGIESDQNPLYQDETIYIELNSYETEGEALTALYDELYSTSNEVLTKTQAQKLLQDYFNNKADDEGNYEVCDELEEGDSEDCYTFALRFSLSEEAAQELIAAGGTPTANKLVDAITVNGRTGEAWYESTGQTFQLW